MIIKTRKQARMKADLLKARLSKSNKMRDEDRKEIQQDVFDLENYVERNVVPDNEWNNVYLWLTGSSYSTLE